MVAKSRKPQYFEKLIHLLQTHKQVLIVGVDFVGSKQMQQVRIALRGKDGGPKAEVLMGKNTMIRTCLRNHHEKDPSMGLDNLVTAVNGNIGFIFCETDLNEIRTLVESMVLPASAKAGVIASKDVFLPAGPTGMDPSQTTFFQTLNIPTKIVKGAIELVSSVQVCTPGKKVTASEAVLLMKMGIKPFEYGIVVQSVFDGGAVFDKAVLDITDDEVAAQFLQGVGNIAALSREVGVPTDAALPHMVTGAVKNMAALCADIDFSFPEIEKLKEFLANPEAFASLIAASAPAAGGAAAKPAAAAAAAPAAAEEEEEDMDFDLFG